jgi:hypothetical protein
MYAAIQVKLTVKVLISLEKAPISFAAFWSF